MYGYIWKSKKAQIHRQIWAAIN